MHLLKKCKPWRLANTIKCCVFPSDRIRKINFQASLDLLPNHGFDCAYKLPHCIAIIIIINSNNTICIIDIYKSSFLTIYPTYPLPWQPSLLLTSRCSRPLNSDFISADIDSGYSMFYKTNARLCPHPSPTAPWPSEPFQTYISTCAALPLLLLSDGGMFKDSLQVLSVGTITTIPTLTLLPDVANTAHNTHLDTHTRNARWQLLILCHAWWQQDTVTTSLLLNAPLTNRTTTLEYRQ